MTYEIRKRWNLDGTADHRNELIAVSTDRDLARDAVIALRALHDGNDYSLYNTELKDWIPVDEYDVDEVEDLELSDEEYKERAK